MRVLVVEDSEDDAFLLVRRLRDGGFEPSWKRVETREGMEACLAGEAWDLVISDFRMPGFRAPEALKVLQNAGLDLPFIIVSGAVGEEAAVECLREGAHDFVRKDNLTRLVPAVERELRDAGIRRKHREDRDALRRSEAELATLLEHSPDIVARFDRKLRHTYVSPAVERVTGRPASVFIGKTNAELGMPADRVALWNESLEEVFRTGEPRTVEFSFETTGELRWFSTRLVPEPAPDGELSSALAISRDVTEERRAERRRRALLENAADGVYVLAPDTTILYASPVTAELTGYSEEELRGKEGLSLVHPEDRTRAKEAFRTLVGEAGKRVRNRYRVVRKDGAVRIHESVATNLLHDPAVEGIVINTRDVTETKELEERLLQSQKMEAIGRLAGGVAHDFNNLLTVIEGRADFLRGDLPEGSPLREDAGEIRQAADRAASLTRQLLAFSRKDIARPRPVELDVLVREMEKMLSRLIGEDIDFVVETPAPADEPANWIVADPGQIEQVMLNLVVNARDAMPHGGRLTIRTERSRLDAGRDRNGGLEPGEYVVLTVSDTGHGIEPDDLRRIFEPFFTTREQGTGLGLATVYGIVDGLGGTIQVESQPDRGTTFGVLFPEAAPEDTPKKEANPQQPAPESGDGSILLVEDDPAVRKLIERILARQGHRVHVAPDGGEALKYLENGEESVDLLVTDLVMPGMTGTRVAEEVRALRPRCAVLFISGYSEERIPDDGDPRTRFLAKPFAVEELTTTVGEMLNEHAASRGVY